MLKYIKKRDGSIEPFDPEKINRWSGWASEEVRSRVDWASVVVRAMRDATETMDSQALQEQLIKQCTRKKSWPYALMAGKLYNAVIRKQLFPNGFPSLVDQHLKMIELGLMRPLLYSLEEYAQADKIIDHDRDMHMPYHAIKQLHRKYGLANVNTDIRYETPQFVYMRMAMALAEDEPAAERMMHVKEWYEMFSRAIINCPTPYYVNLGTRHNGYASCCLYAAGDNARSLAIGDHIAYTMTYMSSGIGGILHCRSYGDQVRGGRIKHQGRILPL
jgi:ribonucleoside-diphosphate reductase alpha chain